MTTHNRRSAWTIALLAVLAVIGAATPAGAQGLGVAPAALDLGEVFRGSQVSGTLTLNNSEDVDVVFDFEPSGQIADWIRMTDENDPSVTISELFIGAGDIGSAGVEISIPDDTPNGTYTGDVIITTSAADPDGLSEGAQAQVSVGLLSSITLEVSGTEQRSANLLDAAVSNAEIGATQTFRSTVSNDGNVSVEPIVEVTITSGDDLIAELTTEERFIRVDPGQANDIAIEWDTSGERAGEYVATFVVTDVAGAAPVEIGTRVVEFTLDPLGTFTRSGEMLDMFLANQPVPGGPVQVEANFQNTGEVDTEIIFAGEVDSDGTLVTAFETLSRVVRPGQTVNLVETIEGLDAGSYSIEGWINFDGEETEHRFVEFEISEDGQIEATGASTSGSGSGGGDSGGDNTTLYLIIGAAVLLVGGGAFFWWRRPPPSTGRHAV